MTNREDLKDLTLLGQGKTQPKRQLETFPNRHPNRRYTVTLYTDEFTAVCPLTGQPDFAKIRVEYIPNERIVESKSFKLYLWSFRNEGVFHEHVTNVILDDLVEALDPHWCRVIARFARRGGIGIDVTAEHHRTPVAAHSAERYALVEPDSAQPRSGHHAERHLESRPEPPAEHPAERYED